MTPIVWRDGDAGAWGSLLHPGSVGNPLPFEPPYAPDGVDDKSRGGVGGKHTLAHFEGTTILFGYAKHRKNPQTPLTTETLHSCPYNFRKRTTRKIHNTYYAKPTAHTNLIKSFLSTHPFVGVRTSPP